MADFLLRSMPNGKPVGVVSETDSYFDPSYRGAQRDLDFVRSKPAGRGWQDWIDSLASRNPVSQDTPTWNLFPHRRASLRVVLQDALDRQERAQ